MGEKKLKNVRARKPKDQLKPHEMINITAKRTGFRREDVSLCIDVLTELIRESIMDRKSVKLKGIGMIFPVVNPPRVLTNMGGQGHSSYKRKLHPPWWSCRFVPEIKLKFDIKDMVVTKKDLAHIYEDVKITKKINK